MSFRDELRRLTEGRLRVDEPLAKYNTFRIGGPADFYVMPRSVREISDVMACAAAENVPLYVLGNGSNLIIPDTGVRGLVLHVTRPIGGIERNGTEIHAGAGVPVVQVMQFAAREGLSGMEWACGIPGTVGGALLTNAGTPAGQMGDCTVAIDIVRRDGSQRRLTPSDFQFSYRQSSLRQSGSIATGATLRLQEADSEAVFDTIRKYNQRRLTTQPVGTRNSGCIFKNASPYRIGQEIERAGLKGRRIGNASVSLIHGNFIINEGEARATDVLALIDEVQETLQQRLGVDLHREVEVWS